MTTEAAPDQTPFLWCFNSRASSKNYTSSCGADPGSGSGSSKEIAADPCCYGYATLSHLNENQTRFWLVLRKKILGLLRLTQGSTWYNSGLILDFSLTKCSRISLMITNKNQGVFCSSLSFLIWWKENKFSWHCQLSSMLARTIFFALEVQQIWIR
jgi:hypothetical protein